MCNYMQIVKVCHHTKSSVSEYVLVLLQLIRLSYSYIDSFNTFVALYIESWYSCLCNICFHFPVVIMFLIDTNMYV